eukprot:Clim_evm13s165 gene=Clim_evmTU13s165
MATIVRRAFSGHRFMVSSRRLALGVECTFDDTGAAVVDIDSGEVISNVLITQSTEHKALGGVYPPIAGKLHKENVGPAINGALEQAGINLRDVTCYGVTTGPGLAPCLAVGVQVLNDLHNRIPGVPWVAVNHMEAHLLSGRMEQLTDGQTVMQQRQQMKALEAKHLQRGAEEPDNGDQMANSNVSSAINATRMEESTPAPHFAPATRLQFPFLGLLISGGHSLLVAAENLGHYAVLGETLDDAPGECLDKVAREMARYTDPLSMPNLGQVNGRFIEQLAGLPGADPYRFDIPIGNAKKRDCSFSFAGVKSKAKFVLRDLVSERRGNRDPEEHIVLPVDLHRDLAASVQSAVARQLRKKTERALLYLRDHKGWHPNGLMVAGGVASNKAVRGTMSALGARYQVPVVFPSPQLCTDNAMMIAWTAGEHYKEGRAREGSPHRIMYHPQWPLGPSMDQDVMEKHIGI